VLSDCCNDWKSSMEARAANIAARAVFLPVESI
jgi:hypothetical protein